MDTHQYCRSSSTTIALPDCGLHTSSHSMPPPLSLPDRLAGALWGIYIADALAMPVHWYYDVRTLQRHYAGGITKYEAPHSRNHPSSIMHLSNTGGHGRGGQQGNVIGDVINHGKKQFWGVPGMHYHQGMVAGENTLNALCTRVVTRCITRARGVYDADAFLKDYVTFMTTPGSHNDTYAESFHRDFFANYAKGVPPARCAKGTEGHNTASIGGLVMLPPVTLSFATQASHGIAQAWQRARAATIQHLLLTHDSSKLASYAEVYSKLLFDVVHGADLRTAVVKAAREVGVDVERIVRSGMSDTDVVQRHFGSACYITSSLPVVLYLAYKHAGDFEAAVLANVNAGGENAHRGAALGALMGAATGQSGIPQRFVDDLHESKAIRGEIDAYITAVLEEDN